MTIEANTFQDRIETMYPAMPQAEDPLVLTTIMGLAQYAQVVAFDTLNLANRAYLTDETLDQVNIVSNMGEMLMAVSRICTALGMSLDEVMHRKLHKPVTAVELLKRRP